MESANSRIKILTVDDHPVLREGIAALLEGQEDMILVAEAVNGREAIEQFRTHRPDVTLMDLQMPEVNGIDAIVSIRSEFPQARILVLTTYKGDVHAAFVCRQYKDTGLKKFNSNGNNRIHRLEEYKSDIQSQ